MARAMTLRDLMKKVPDSRLVIMYDELTSRMVPNTSEVKELVTRVNRLIDRGEMCINETNYRHVYTPSIQKAILCEMAYRYISLRKQITVDNNECPDYGINEVEYDKLLGGALDGSVKGM